MFKYPAVKRLIAISSKFLHSASFENLPRITCPQKLQQKLQHAKEKKLHEKFLYRQQLKKRGPLIIFCKRKQYNFYEGDNFNEFDSHLLVSFDWKSKKKVGDFFSILPYSENPSLIAAEESCTFEHLGINERLSDGLKELGISSPTRIQEQAIPCLLEGSNAICASETGSGKTLAYILPAIEWILRNKKFRTDKKDEATHSNLNSPNTIILTPSRDLTQQVMSVAESLKPYADFIPFLLEPKREKTKKAIIPMDMLICTPGALVKQLKSKQILGMNLQHMIIDESDSLFDDSFIDDIQKILQMLFVQAAENVDTKQSMLAGTQIVLVSATLPRNADRLLGDFVPLNSLVKISTHGLHRLMTHVKQTFLRINTLGKGQKLVELLKNDEPCKGAIIFTNKSITCNYLAKLLETNGIECLRLNGEMSPNERYGVFQKFRSGYVNVLVATDIASRGLDTINVQHVINYDFPTFISDYIHRVGRVGRVGSKLAGQVTSFITHRWDVEMVWKIEMAARKRKKLEDVNANIKMKLNQLSLMSKEEDAFELNEIK